MAAVGGSVNVSRSLSALPGTTPPLSWNPAGGSTSARWIGSSKPSRRRAWTVIGTVAPGRAMMQDGTTRKSKSGRGGRMYSR